VQSFQEAHLPRNATLFCREGRSESSNCSRRNHCRGRLDSCGLTNHRSGRVEEKVPSSKVSVRAAQLNHWRVRDVHTNDGIVSGYLRRPVLLTPVIATISLLAIEAIRSPSDVSFSGTDWIVFALFGTFFAVILVTIFGLIPMIVGAAILMAVCRVLPGWLVRIAALRMATGGLIGCLVGLPFTYVLNFIPSAGSEPRFSYISILFASAVSGGFCAAFYSELPPDALSNNSLDRTRDK
jgi:hypothetical protein